MKKVDAGLQKRAEPAVKPRMAPAVKMNEGTGQPPNNYTAHSAECVKILFNFVTTTVTQTAKHSKTVVADFTQVTTVSTLMRLS